MNEHERVPLFTETLFTTLDPVELKKRKEKNLTKSQVFILKGPNEESPKQNRSLYNIQTPGEIKHHKSFQ